MTGNLVDLTRSVLRRVVAELVADSPLMAELSKTFGNTLVLYGGFLRDVVDALYEFIAGPESPFSAGWHTWPTSLLADLLVGKFGLANVAEHFVDIDLSTAEVRTPAEIVEIVSIPSVAREGIWMKTNIGGSNAYGNGITARSTSKDPATTSTVTDTGKSGRKYVIQFSTASKFTHLDFSVNTLAYFFNGTYISTYEKTVTGAPKPRYSDNIVYDHIANKRLLVPSHEHVAWHKFAQRTQKMVSKGYSAAGRVGRADMSEDPTLYALNVSLTEMYMLRGVVERVETRSSTDTMLPSPASH